MGSQTFYELFEYYIESSFSGKSTGGSVITNCFRGHTEFDEEYKEFWAAYAVHTYRGGEPVNEL